MKLITYTAGIEPRIGVVLNDGMVIDARDCLEVYLAGRHRQDAKAEAAFMVPADMTTLLARAGGDLSLLSEAVAASKGKGSLSIGSVTLHAPVPRPGKILGVGRNYGSHASEGGLLVQDEPRLFVKVGSSVVGPGAVIAYPALVSKMDWEVELGVVIGKPMHNVAQEDALSHVAGYTIINDISAREFQFDVKPPQTSFAKSLDGFTPMGPVLLTADELPDPTHVTLCCWINEQLMQKGNTEDMIFSVAYILSYISRYMTLEPGDLIATGTPSGVGCFRDPPIYLKTGDNIRMEIPQIGVLENSIGDKRR